MVLVSRKIGAVKWESALTYEIEGARENDYEYAWAYLEREGA